jgi:hypothetical protein
LHTWTVYGSGKVRPAQFAIFLDDKSPVRTATATCRRGWLRESTGLKSSVDKQSLEINGAMPTSVSIRQLTPSLHV